MFRVFVRKHSLSRRLDSTEGHCPTPESLSGRPDFVRSRWPRRAVRGTSSRGLYVTAAARRRKQFAVVLLAFAPKEDGHYEWDGADLSEVTRCFSRHRKIAD